jgi:hypothetical protein
MANPLTGDFEAVLQVSGGTINRLLATLHQNAFANANLPSFPHSVRMRIGDDHAIDGVRGRVDCQISVPRVELIHGATDRFMLEVGVRAWYRPDPGTGPLPAFIHGAVRAMYHFQDIDPACLGWSQHASDHLWIGVIKDSVQFVGTADDDRSPLDSAVGILSANPAAADAANVARITRQIAGLLATRFEATPHPVSKRFRRGSMLSLNVPTAGSAVATPIGLSGEPAGNIASIANLLLDGADLAVGVSLDYIMSVVTPALDSIKTFNKTVAIHISTPWYMPDINTVYHASVDPPTIEWLPNGNYAVIKIKVHGRATTNSVLADATFDVEQDITLGFDPGGPNFTLTHGTPGVTVHAGGLYPGTVAGAVQDSILASVPPLVQAACDQAQPSLDAMTTRTQELSQQLSTLDDKAAVSLDHDASFLPDGMVLRGTISLARRQAPVVKFEKTAAQDAYNALESWIPGGRIDTFEWSWTWSGSGASGTASRSDRFLLRRPAGKVGRWGAMLDLAIPLPGLDGNGSICLRIKGVRVDPVTGELVPVESAAPCTRFGLNIAGIRKGDRLFLRDMPELSKRVPFPQLALIGTKPASQAAAAANTLVLYVDQAWDRETAATLEGGLNDCRRFDAGLSLLVLFREGVLEAGGARLVGEVEAFARTLGISAVVNEDVGAGWSGALGLRTGTGEPGWGLISPEGNTMWTQQGHIEPGNLARALDINLRRCPDPAPTAFGLSVGVGERVISTTFNPGWFDENEPHCPPLPVGGRGGVAGTVVTFVQKQSAASVAELRRIAAQHAQRQDQSGTLVVAVVDGADPREVEALKAEVGLEFVALSDAAGIVTQRFGVEVWPTTMTVDESGTISAIEAGVSAHREGAQ